ncbi:MAG: xanthine dehydrogenase family protein molybdopterin-binding subunit [Beijerinckiaceae bacterium]
MTVHPGNMKKFGIGQPVRRLEDAKFITGAGQYTDDISPTGVVHAFVLRSPHAHATFTLGELKTARGMKGVRAVYTAADLKGMTGVACQAPMKMADGKTMKTPEWPLLCRDKVMHLGDAVALVVADTLAQARDAAEAIEVDYKPLPVVTTISQAIKPGVPMVWSQAPGNVAFDQTLGKEEKTNAAFAKAAHVVKLTVDNNRLVTNYMETRACIGTFDAKADRYTLTLGSQGVHGIQGAVGAVMGIKPEQLRVITPDVGGGFGTKSFNYREYPLVLFAAKALGRPVKWTQERTEHFLSCAQGRDNLTSVELALDARGKFLALRVHIRGNLGAYASQYGPYIPWLGATMATGPYDIRTMFVRCQGIYTHTVPVDAYRGAGRPEAAYVLERLVDKAARQLGLKPEVLRARNFVKSSAMPYKTQTARTYDVGEFEGHMTAALEKADQKGFKERMRASKKAGKLRGFGFASYIECTAWGSGEDVEVTLGKDGGLTLTIGTQSNGQGHMTAYAQAVSQALDVPLDKIKVIQGDTDTVKTGHGTGGSRSIPVGAVSAYRASESLGDKLKELAAEKLEASVADMVLGGGRITVVGTDKSMSFADIAVLPAATPDMLAASNEFVPPDATYPNGTHVAEVEVDAQTGVTKVVKYTIVDDFGLTVNPLLLGGQVHGGIVQGIGQALLERTVYDSEGQLLTASFMDYTMPRADDAPYFDFTTRNVPSTTNPLGIKGAGEAGSIGSCPAVMNALVDALFREKGTTHIDMPATPERVWQALSGKGVAT